MLLKDLELVQKAFQPSRGELRGRRVAVYDPSMKFYIGKRAKVISKDGEGMSLVRYPDASEFWFPPEDLRPSLLTASHFTPYHHFPVSESDLDDAEIGIWRCSFCLRNSSAYKDIGKPWVCRGGTDFRLCKVCVFSAPASESRSIFVAAEKGNLQLLLELVDEEGVDVNSLKPISTWSPLHYAARHGHLIILEALLRRGANPDFRDIDGRAPIHCAAEFNHSKCALLLIACGAKYWLMNKFGKDAYILAMERGNEVIARAIQRKIDEKKMLENTELEDTDGDSDMEDSVEEDNLGGDL